MLRAKAGIGKRSDMLDVGSATANMYGFEPCPKCGSKYRCAFNDAPGVIQCDGCAFTERYVLKEDA